MTPPRWIRTTEELDALVSSLRGAQALSWDTEADGLHHYPAKLCLVQVADNRGQSHLIDPLALPAAQETYALNDVLHLIPLRDRLAEELRGKGRLAWVEEECAAVAAMPAPSTRVDPDAYMGLKGAKDLDGRGLAVLRELHLAREALAVKLDRPPFMILGNESLVALAALRPRDSEAILTVRGCTANVVRRAGEAILAAVERGLSVPDSEVPVRKNRPRPSISGAVQRRREVLRLWRVDASKQVGLDPGVIFPQRLIDRLSADPPKDVEALARVEGVGRWRAELFGADLLRRLS